jgi:hypothetical protein
MKGPFPFLIILLYCGCGQDAFRQVVEVDLPEHISAPAVSVELIGGDSVIRYSLSRSFGILEEEPDDGRATELTVYRGDRQIGRATGVVANQPAFMAVDSMRQIWLDEPIPTEPADYRIEATIAGTGSATAEQRMPRPPRVSVKEYSGREVIDGNGFRRGVATIEIEDPPGEANYYAIRAVVEDSIRTCSIDRDSQFVCQNVYGSRLRSTSSPDPTVRELEYFYQAGLRDDGFDGRRYTLEVHFRINENGMDRNPRLEVFSLTEDAFRYLVSVAAYQDARNNPFAEPVTVHNFIEDGYGYLITVNKVVLPLTP